VAAAEWGEAVREDRREQSRYYVRDNYQAGTTLAGAGLLTCWNYEPLRGTRGRVQGRVQWHENGPLMEQGGGQMGNVS
jgi:hypothetical protein